MVDDLDAAPEGCPRSSCREFLRTKYQQWTGLVIAMVAKLRMSTCAFEYRHLFVRRARSHVVATVTELSPLFLAGHSGAAAVNDRQIEEAVVMQPLYRGRKNGVEAAINLPAPQSAVDARVVDLPLAGGIPFDRQRLPLASGVQQLQYVVEGPVQTQCRRRPVFRCGKTNCSNCARLRFTESLATIGFQPFTPSRNLDDSRSANQLPSSKTRATRRQIRPGKPATS